MKILSDIFGIPRMETIILLCTALDMFVKKLEDAHKDSSQI